jgi:hypothetical protein
VDNEILEGESVIFVDRQATTFNRIDALDRNHMIKIVKVALGCGLL